MREQLRRAGTPAPKVVGIDEISIRKGRTYRIVVSDLERRRPIWFGGNDRSEERMGAFYKWLGPTKSKKMRLAVAVRPIQRADYHPPLRRMRRGDICGSLLLPAEGVVDVARLDALHHVVIEIGPALGTSQLPPDQLIIPLALLDHSGGFLVSRSVTLGSGAGCMTRRWEGSFGSSCKDEDGGSASSAVDQPSNTARAFADTTDTDLGMTRVPSLISPDRD